MHLTLLQAVRNTLVVHDLQAAPSAALVWQMGPPAGTTQHHGLGQKTNAHHLSVTQLLLSAGEGLCFVLSLVLPQGGGQTGHAPSR